MTDKLDELTKSLLKKGCSFSYSREVVDKIVSSSKIKGLGARPILREISSQIEEKIIDLLIMENSISGSIEATVQSDNIKIVLKNVIKT